MAKAGTNKRIKNWLTGKLKKQPNQPAMTKLILKDGHGWIDMMSGSFVFNNKLPVNN